MREYDPSAAFVKMNLPFWFVASYRLFRVSFALINETFAPTSGEREIASTTVPDSRTCRASAGKPRSTQVRTMKKGFRIPEREIGLFEAHVSTSTTADWFNLREFISWPSH